MNAAPPTAASARTRRLLARFARGATALTFVVIVASAFMRHTQAGLGCVDWPSCYARVATDAQAAVPSIGVSLARLLHRLAASSALLLIVGMLLVARAGQTYKRERRLALAALVVALSLAALGIATPGAEVPAVPLGNLLGGFVMIALLAALAGAVANGSGETGRVTASPLRWFALALLGFVFLQATLGGFIGTQFALRSCPALDHCVGAAGDAFARGAALDPFQRQVVDGHVLPPVGAAGLHSMHRLLGIAVALAALALAYALRSSNRHGAALLAVLAVTAPSLGVTAILRMPSLPVTVLHNAAAAMLIATLAYISAMRRASWTAAS